MIDEVTIEDLKDASKLRLVLLSMKSSTSHIKQRLDDLDGIVNDNDKGLKITLHDLIDDVNTLDEKLNTILESQKDTRKTIKNSVLGGGIGVIVTTIVGFVLKQIGFY